MGPAFEDGLRTLGHVPGATITIEYRSAEARAPTLPAMAMEAVGLHPQIIVAIGTTAAIAARQATANIPIVTVSGTLRSPGWWRT